MLRVQVIAPYNLHVIAACKCVPQRSYENEMKAWSVPFTQLPHLVKALEALRPVEVLVEPLHKLSQRMLDLR